MRYERGRIDGVILWISFLSQNSSICTIVADIIEVQHENTQCPVSFNSGSSVGVVLRYGPVSNQRSLSERLHLLEPPQNELEDTWRVFWLLHLVVQSMNFMAFKPIHGWFEHPSLVSSCWTRHDSPFPSENRHVTLDYRTNQSMISRVQTIKKLDILPHMWSSNASNILNLKSYLKWTYMIFFSSLSITDKALLLVPS